MNNSALQIIKDDPYLNSYAHTFHTLRQQMDALISSFAPEGGLDELSLSYKRYGLHCVEKGKQGFYKYVYQEWAPNAIGVSIFGDFNSWNRNEFFATKNQFGLWTCQLTLKHEIPEFSKIKCQVVLPDHQKFDRIPAWINYAIQDENTKGFDGAYIQLAKYQFKNQRPKWSHQEVGLKVYQCHIGMSNIQPKINTYKNFKSQVLPYIASLGYNTIQIMGIMEHPYYGSFGYHVTNFFSLSSRCGTPQDFKQLVDEAHALNIKVIIDLVHAHAAKNIDEGLNYWDGTEYQYFHSGSEGIHPQWDSRIFNYSKYEVLRFLLSNIRFWLDEYNIDGYRFDGVTSILYKHHGVDFAFTGNYDQYFNADLLNFHGVVYLMTANLLAKNILSDVILIAEDVSGFPALCRTHEDGGIGFNFRLSMAIPDMWIKLLKQIKDEDWDMEHIIFQLTNRRWKEKCITYCESHDQALVGDKTISMWLFDSEIYTNMSVFNEETPIIFRGIALHKMIRLLTMSLGGEGYLNFMGNEFGHPQWVDFPREGNNWSYHYCRRRWDLCNNQDLRYHYLLAFEKAMIKLDEQCPVLGCTQYVRTKDNKQKVMVFEKDKFLFVFNWSTCNSYEGYLVYVKRCEEVKVIWSTEDKQFGGQGRVFHQSYKTEQYDTFCSRFRIYLPNRCAIVFKIIL